MVFGVLLRVIMLVIARFMLQDAGRGHSFFDILYSFLQWDAYSYRYIVEEGYGWLVNGEPLFVVFFPLFPFLVRIFVTLTGNYLIGSFIVTFTAYLGGIIFVYKLARLDYSATTAWLAVLFISIFPFGIFHGAPHPESLFMLTTASTLYFIRKHNWIAAGIAGALATANRLTGVMVIAAALVEFFTHYKIFALLWSKKWREIGSLFAKKGLWILLMFGGLIVYLFINYRVTGDAFRFMYYQETNWNNGFLYFGEAMIMQFDMVWNNIVSGNTFYYAQIGNITSFALCIFAVSYAAAQRTGEKRQTNPANPAMLTYTLGMIFTSFSMAWLLSGGRYTAGIIPVFIYLADYAGKKIHRAVLILIVFIVFLLPILQVYIMGGHVL